MFNQPSVSTSHIRIPKDHLLKKEKMSRVSKLNIKSKRWIAYGKIQEYAKILEYIYENSKEHFPDPKLVGNYNCCF